MNDKYEIYNERNKVHVNKYRSFSHQLSRLNKNSPLQIRGFTEFSLLLQKGFKQVTYNATTNSLGMFYWVNKRHMSQLTKVLRGKKLDYFALCFTMTENDEGFIQMANELGEHNTVIKKFVVSHKSGDEVTVKETEGLGRVLTMFKTEFLSIWAAEFDEGSLQVLVDTLKKFGNKTLKKVDICDTTKKEPNDQIHFEPLESYVKKNRRK